MRRPGMMSGATGGTAHVNTVQYRTAGCPTEGCPLLDRLLVDLAVHDDHNDTRDPEGHAGTDYRVRKVHHEHADLRSQKPKAFNRAKRVKLYVVGISFLNYI